jgi:hypothetical protein
VRIAALVLIVVACVLAVWSVAATPVFRASIRVDIGPSAAGAPEAAAIMRSRAVVEAALKSLPPASQTSMAKGLSSRLAVRPLPATRLVEITARESDADRAFGEVSALATAYVGFVERAAGEGDAAASAALAEERRAHERALNEARARLRQQCDAAASAETYRILLANALERRGAIRQPPPVTAIAEDPIVQILKMRVTVLEGARMPVEAAVALVRGDLAVREAQLAAAIDSESDGARREEALIDEEISTLRAKLDSMSGQASAAASTQATIADEEAALQVNHEREVELRLKATDRDAPRIVDGAVEEDHFRADLAYAAWFAAAIAMLVSLLSA